MLPTDDENDDIWILFPFSALFAVLENGVTYGKALVGSHWHNTCRHMCGA